MLAAAALVERQHWPQLPGPVAAPRSRPPAEASALAARGSVPLPLRSAPTQSADARNPAAPAPPCQARRTVPLALPGDCVAPLRLVSGRRLWRARLAEAERP